MKRIEEFKALLASPKKVVITTHVRPDADALGSSLGLQRYLTMKGHDVVVITPSKYPRFLFWMTGNDDVVIYGPDTDEQSRTLIKDADMIFCLDFSALHRINELGEMIAGSPAVKVLIDHHQEPEDFADFSLWNSNAAATAELIYELIEMLGDKSMVDVEIGECLYAGIMTDTGSFRFSSTSSRVHQIIADLIDIGVDNSKVHQLVYDNSTENRLRLLGHVLSKCLHVVPEYSTAYVKLSKKDLYRFNAQTGDTEGIVNYALAIEGIKFAALMKESEGIIKLSFRSAGDFSVSDFSKKNFHGGGHHNAAGGRSDVSLDETEKKFLDLLKEQGGALKQ